jgi:hypothetical protein
MTVAKELQNISYNYWEYRRSGGIEVAPDEQENAHVSAERGMRIMTYVQGSVHNRILSAVQRVEFVCDWMSFVIYEEVAGACSQRSMSQQKMDSFYEKLECVFNRFPQYYMKILLRDFIAKIGKEGIFKRTVRSKNL